MFYVTRMEEVIHILQKHLYVVFKLFSLNKYNFLTIICAQNITSRNNFNPFKFENSKY